MTLAGVMMTALPMRKVQIIKQSVCRRGREKGEREREREIGERGER